MERKIANPIRRFLGYVIDWLIGAGPLLALGYSLGSSAVLSKNIYMGLDGALTTITAASLWAVVFPILNAFLTSKLGGSIGKIATNTKVVDGSGRLISFYKAIFRNYIGYSVSGTIACLGFIWILIDKKNHRAWHDLIADTFVVRVS